MSGCAIVVVNLMQTPAIGATQRRVIGLTILHPAPLKHSHGNENDIHLYRTWLQPTFFLSDILSRNRFLHGENPCNSMGTILSGLCFAPIHHRDLFYLLK